MVVGDLETSSRQGFNTSQGSLRTSMSAAGGGGVSSPTPNSSTFKSQHIAYSSGVTPAPPSLGSWRVDDLKRALASKPSAGELEELKSLVRVLERRLESVQGGLDRVVLGLGEGVYEGVGKGGKKETRVEDTGEGTSRAKTDVATSWLEGDMREELKRRAKEMIEPMMEVVRAEVRGDLKDLMGFVGQGAGSFEIMTTAPDMKGEITEAPQPTTRNAGTTEVGQIDLTKLKEDIRNEVLKELRDSGAFQVALAPTTETTPSKSSKSPSKTSVASQPSALTSSEPSATMRQKSTSNTPTSPNQLSQNLPSAPNITTMHPNQSQSSSKQTKPKEEDLLERIRILEQRCIELEELFQSKADKDDVDSIKEKVDVMAGLDELELSGLSLSGVSWNGEAQRLRRKQQRLHSRSKSEDRGRISSSSTPGGGKGPEHAAAVPTPSTQQPTRSSTPTVTYSEQILFLLDKWRDLDARCGKLEKSGVKRSGTVGDDAGTSRSFDAGFKAGSLADSKTIADLQSQLEQLLNSYDALDYRVSSLTDIDLKAIKTSISKLADANQHDKLNSTEHQRSLAQLKRKLDEILDGHNSFKDELADQMESLRYVQGRMDSQVVTVELLKDQISKLAKTSNDKSEAVNVSGKLAGIDKVEETGAPTPNSLSNSRDGPSAANTTSPSFSHNIPAEYRQELLNIVKLQVKDELEHTKRKLNNKVDTAVLEELLKHLATREELKRASEKLKSYAKDLAGRATLNAANGSQVLTKEVMESAISKAITDLALSSKLDEIRNEFEANLLKVSQDVQTHLAKLEDMAQMSAVSAPSTFSFNVSATTSAESFSQSQHVNVELKPGTEDNCESPLPLNAQAPAAGFGGVDNHALLGRVKKVIKDFEGSWWSALDRWLCEQMQAKVAELLDSQRQLQSSKKANEDSFVMSDSSHFSSSSSALAGNDSSGFEIGQDWPPSAPQLEQGNVMGGLVGASTKGKRSKTQEELVEDLGAKLTRDFDEKMFLLCADLRACKVAYEASARQPFYRCGQWVWRSSVLKFGSAIPWNLETSNTDPENFRWEENQCFIKVMQGGLYEITFAFFTKAKPSIQLVINGESVLSAINSPTYVVHHPPTGPTGTSGSDLEFGASTGLSLLKMDNLRIVEVVITTSTQDNVIELWDLRSGAVLATFKGNQSMSKTLAVSPMPTIPNHSSLLSQIMISAQSERPVAHVWSWQKEQVLAKITLPEKLSSLAVSHSGRFCVGGGSSGRVYIWELASGNMPRMFDAHYKAVNVVKFSCDDEAFLTAGEDGVLQVWLLGSVLHKKENEDSAKAFRVYSGHHLPITDAEFSSDLFHRSRVFSCSADKTVKVWDIASKKALLTVAFPAPLTCIAVDPIGMHVYAGGKNGIVYQALLYKDIGNQRIAQLSENQISSDTGNERSYAGHRAAITSLALSFDSKILVSGSEDGSAITNTNEYEKALDGLWELETSAQLSNEEQMDRMKEQLEFMTEHSKGLLQANNDLYQAAVKRFLSTRAANKPQ
ncbi:WD repeat-containing protein 18 [Chytridiales sp. JEL 0842]|nr:WD repeat-containing protein 18 [Chytridiales sp. JEL 0842]